MFNELFKKALLRSTCMVLGHEYQMNYWRYHEDDADDEPYIEASWTCPFCGKTKIESLNPEMKREYDFFYADKKK